MLSVCLCLPYSIFLSRYSCLVPALLSPSNWGRASRVRGRGVEIVGFGKEASQIIVGTGSGGATGDFLRGFGGGCHRVHVDELFGKRAQFTERREIEQH